MTSITGTAARALAGFGSTSIGRAFGSWLGKIAGGFLVLLLLTAIFAPWITPFDYAAQDLTNGNAPPGWPHLLGTDQFGRDVLSRVIYGARTSLSVSATAIAISITVGMTLGAAAGYIGGMFERAVMTVVDLTWSFPDILIALIFVAIIGPGLTSTTFAIAIAYLAQFTRLTRAQIVRLKRETFIEATVNLGAKPRHILLRHLLPNAITPVIVVGMLAIGDGIVLEATLGFFGLGAQPPTPSWGAMMSSGTAQLFLSPWVIIFPGVVVAVTVIAVNLFGDELIRALDIKDRIRGA
ncbi:ABC transporter permease [Sulfitobacter mediterraneus]|jgi:peptide/nickel transport system permease protein|uniref:ABC transporter permease n=1 Tax=Sulfitobacter TaxID=60136 RepID=UPI001934A031|nr:MULTISPECIES: ABC transporter permease [Sulfitobacter]MBM1635159.1 ABC transporter permease [Sulfitobacter mediterraneus]MBM1642983.1 ABC transporter permease [Sulfitobacter mediterraneus]MBM1647031.1 ABC transporter permease [Sulfitobacter mediterraneus]MBM1651073.1 ABC transporter permease [Sulfitobacter mediterraneus]MBM1655026.1 ABC transporter permease [Sulfitobacter mediterraneus]